MLTTSALYHYFGVFVALVAAGVGFPIPEEIPVVTGGVLVGQNQDELRWWIMLPVCIAGVVISDGLLYSIGRLWGPRLLEYRWIKTHLLTQERLHHIEDNFRRYGVKILLFARFLPAIRSPIFITAGLMRLSFTRFLIADGIYAIPGVSLLFFLGFWFTDQFLAAVERAESYRPLVVVVILAAVASYLFYHFLHQPVATGDPKEFPVIGDQVAKMSPSAHSISLDHSPDNSSLPLGRTSRPKRPAARPKSLSLPPRLSACSFNPEPAATAQHASTVAVGSGLNDTNYLDHGALAVVPSLLRSSRYSLNRLSNSVSGSPASSRNASTGSVPR